MKKTLKKELSLWLQKTTFHGLPNLFVRDSNIASKLLWSVSILISGGFCSFLIIQTLFNFLNYEVITKVQVVNKIPFEFPKVTICSSSAFTTSKAIQFLNHIDPSIPGNIGAFYKNLFQLAFAYNQQDLVKRSFGLDIDVSLSDFFHFKCILI